MTLTPRTKQILAIIGFIIIVIILTFALYFLFFRRIPSIGDEVRTDPDQETSGIFNLPGSEDAAGDNQTTDSEDTDETLTPSPIADGGPTLTQQLTTSDILAPNISSQNSITYYNPEDGRFYSIDRNGNISTISDEQFLSASTVVIADSNTVAALEFPDGSNILFNLETGEETVLPAHWEEFEFSSNGEEVISKSLGSDPNNQLLTRTSSDGSQTDVILGMGENEDAVTVNWSPNGHTVGFSETGSALSGFGRQEIFLIGIDGEDAGRLVVEGSNFSALWSPNGSYLLYSVAEANNDYLPSLWYVKGTGEVGSDRVKIDVATWVEKCTFMNETTAYCAVPRELERQSGLNQNSVTAYDDVYKINLTTGRSTLIAQPTNDLRMFNLFITSDQSTLYFTDQSNNLHTLRLK